MILSNIETYGLYAYKVMEDGILYRLNFSTYDQEPLAILPPKYKNYDAKAKCMLYDDSILCIPINYGEIIIYDIRNDIWKETGIIFSEIEGIKEMSIVGDKLFIVFMELGKVIEYDLNTMMLAGEFIIENNIRLKHYSFNDNRIIVNDHSNQYIYIFDCRLEKIIKVLSPAEGQMIVAKGYKDGKLYIGSQKKILYIVDVYSNTMDIVGDFPLDYGSYGYKFELGWYIDYKLDNSLTVPFGQLIFINNEIWMIPYLANYIVYMDICTHKINKFYIEEEDEKCEEYIKYVKMRFVFRYLVMHVFLDRFFILYSCFSGKKLEIDARNKYYRVVDFDMNQDGVIKKGKMMLRERNICYEKWGIKQSIDMICSVLE